MAVVVNGGVGDGRSDCSDRRCMTTYLDTRTTPFLQAPSFPRIEALGKSLSVSPKSRSSPYEGALEAGKRKGTGAAEGGGQEEED